MKKKFKILDYMFAHATYSTDYQDSKFIEWDRTPVNNNDKIVFYTDYSLDRVRPTPITIGWLLESPDITSQSHQWAGQNNKRFTYVLTHSKEFLDRGENFVFSPTGGCWIKPEDQKVWDKNINTKAKMLSIIASPKRTTHGHLMRHQAIQKLGNFIDAYGTQYKPMTYKLTGLKDYMFSLTIENTKKDYYFTEKLIDCFRTGTVPVYWGCPSIGNFFDVRGMIIFDKIDDLDNISLTKEKYEEMLPYIQANFEKAEEFLIAEDYIYTNLLQKII